MGTVLTLANGRTLELAAGYEDTKAFLARRTLAADDGLREVRLTDGETLTIGAGAVICLEAARETKRNAIGFAAALARYEEAA